jgi:hypothetical protein
MQHDAHPLPDGALPSLEHSVAVFRALWPSLCTDDRRALRLCSATMRDAVDAQASCVEEGQDEAPVLCPATCARLDGVHTLTLYTMACLRNMLLVAPAPGQEAGAVFPRLRSLRLRLVGAPLLCTQLHARLIKGAPGCRAWVHGPAGHAWPHGPKHAMRCMA